MASPSPKEDLNTTWITTSLCTNLYYRRSQQYLSVKDDPRKLIRL